MSSLFPVLEELEVMPKFHNDHFLVDLTLKSPNFYLRSVNYYNHIPPLQEGNILLPKLVFTHLS